MRTCWRMYWKSLGLPRQRGDPDFCGRGAKQEALQVVEGDDTLRRGTPHASRAGRLK